MKTLKESLFDQNLSKKSAIGSYCAGDIQKTENELRNIINKKYANILNKYGFGWEVYKIGGGSAKALHINLDKILPEDQKTSYVQSISFRFALLTYAKEDNGAYPYKDSNINAIFCVPYMDVDLSFNLHTSVNCILKDFWKKNQPWSNKLQFNTDSHKFDFYSADDVEIFFDYFKSIMDYLFTDRRIKTALEYIQECAVSPVIFDYPSGSIEISKFIKEMKGKLEKILK